MSHHAHGAAPYLCTMKSDSSVPIITIGSKAAADNDKPSLDDLLDKAISALYTTRGTTEQLCFRTTAEVMLEISDVIDADLQSIAKWMQQHDCDTRVIDGTLCWVLYDSRDPSRL